MFENNTSYYKKKVVYFIKFLLYLVRSYVQHDGPKTAAYLTFTALFAVVPVMTVTFSILALIPDLKGADGQLESYLFEHFMPATGEHLQSYLIDFSKQAANLTSIGVVMLFVTSITMLRKIEGSFNEIWHVKESRKGVSGFLLYWALLSLGPLLMGATIAISSYLSSLRILEQYETVQATQQVLFSFLPIMLSTLAFSLAYVAIPNTRVPLKHAITGGLVAALLFDLARRLMTLLVTFFPTYQLVYGAFAAVPIFLIWIFVSWSILLIGAEFVQALTSYKVSMHKTASSLGDILQILKLLYENQQMGNSMSEEALINQMPWLTPLEWEYHYKSLQEAKLVTLQSEGDVLLSRDLHCYTFAQLYRSCFPGALSLNLKGEDYWKENLNDKFNDGVDQLLEAWQVPLSEVFESQPGESKGDALSELTNITQHPAIQKGQCNPSD
ncbi:hypothetical protein A9Q99_09120 [Gammaproteobacteria bacterium 45_16_T64]|nr:hypothetical protein A9Q99_09120 [Gammaproteobacteria bacterium 45_16_T64]